MVDFLTAQNYLKWLFLLDYVYLKLTCRRMNRRHICFNIKSISVHPLLWMNVMLDFICMSFAEMWTTFRKQKIQKIMYASPGNRTIDPLLSSMPL